MKQPPQIVGNIGLYWVCFKLSELGWNVMPTSRSARGIDAICYNMDGTRVRTIQVKSLSKRKAVPLGKDLDKIMGDFWIIVNSLDTGKPRTYILLPDEVRDSAQRDRIDAGGAYWLEPKKYAVDEFEEKWERLAAEVVVKAPLHSIGAASHVAALLLGHKCPNLLPRRALPRGRSANLGATRGFTTDC